jgi:hypothetical protein
MARGYSSAGSESTSIRARAYPGIWEKKTKAAIEKVVSRRGEDFPNEKANALLGVESIAKLLKKHSEYVFLWTDVVPTGDKDYPFELQATLSKPGTGQKGVAKIGAFFNTKSEAENVSERIGEGMDLNESGRPLNLRRDTTEDEEAKYLDESERKKATTVQLETFERRKMRERYADWVQKTTARYYAEQKKANEEAIARNKNK